MHRFKYKFKPSKNYILNIIALVISDLWLCVCACDREHVSYNIIAFANNNLMQKLALSVSSKSALFFPWVDIHRKSNQFIQFIKQLFNQKKNLIKQLGIKECESPEN